MKNSELVELNFRKLLHYDNVPDLGSRSSFPIPCKDYCRSCEENGYLDSGDHRLDQMSHGADTEDIEKSICKLPPGGLEVSIAFLLESPGGYYGLNEKIPSPSITNVTKRPPVNCYYWTPRSPRATWPKNPSELPSEVDGDGMYGPYFAYIIATHNLRNVYITNIIKCSLAMRDADKFIPFFDKNSPNNSRDAAILNNCYARFLSQEMKIVNPQIVFCFGRKAKRMVDYAGLNSLLPTPATQFVTLWHPAARYRSSSKIISHNDELIRDAIGKQRQT